MGYTSYSTESRDIRAKASGFETKLRDEIFTQNIKRRIHESMSPKNFKIREARDSDEHSTTLPVILALDLTGSMGHIPHSLIRDGLPKLMSNIIQHGFNDAALLFLGIGDHECDRYPLQVGQFESGDEELDMWLTRTYIEGGGGGNHGESYLLAWYLAAFHTETDSFQKRGKKGVLITTGDEPGLNTIPENALREIFGDNGQYQTYSDVELLKIVSEKWEVYHILIDGRSRSYDSNSYWNQLLGDRCIKIYDHEDLPNKVSELVVKHSKDNVLSTNKISDDSINEPQSNENDGKEEIL